MISRGWELFLSRCSESQPRGCEEHLWSLRNAHSFLHSSVRRRPRVCSHSQALRLCLSCLFHLSHVMCCVRECFWRVWKSRWFGLSGQVLSPDGVLSYLAFGLQLKYRKQRHICSTVNDHRKKKIYICLICRNNSVDSLKICIWRAQMQKPLSANWNFLLGWLFLSSLYF